MLASQSPLKIPLAFAANGTKNAIPTASQIGIAAGRASLNDGFPPLTFTPLAAGGVPPDGADFNGLFNLITAMQQWQSAGGFFKYDAAFSTSVGGYPKGAMLVKTASDGFWLCTVDSNTSNPDTGGAGWSDLGAAFGGRPGHVYTANDWAWMDKPGGLIVQWLSVSMAIPSTANTHVNQAFSFPITFPGALLSIGATPAIGVFGSSSDVTEVFECTCGFSQLTTAGGTIRSMRISGSSDGNPIGFPIFAIGR